MTKKLEEILGIEPVKPTELSDDLSLDNSSKDTVSEPVATKLQARLESFDKLSSALPRVGGLGATSDREFDQLADKAVQAFDDLMDLGMNVEARYSGRLFEVAATMLGAAITAKSQKIDKKLKVVNLQLKKLNLQQRNNQVKKEESVETEGFIVTDRNSILKQLKDLNKQEK